MDYRADVDMQELLDASDAPIWILSDNQQEFEPTNTEAPYHHPYHACGHGAGPSGGAGGGQHDPGAWDCRPEQ